MSSVVAAGAKGRSRQCDGCTGKRLAASAGNGGLRGARAGGFFAKRYPLEGSLVQTSGLYRKFPGGDPPLPGPVDSAGVPSRAVGPARAQSTATMTKAPRRERALVALREVLSAVQGAVDVIAPVRGSGPAADPVIRLLARMTDAPASNSLLVLQPTHSLIDAVLLLRDVCSWQARVNRETLGRARRAIQDSDQVVRGADRIQKEVLGYRARAEEQARAAQALAEARDAAVEQSQTLTKRLAASEAAQAALRTRVVEAERAAASREQESTALASRLRQTAAAASQQQTLQSVNSVAMSTELEDLRYRARSLEKQLGEARGESSGLTDANASLRAALKKAIADTKLFSKRAEELEDQCSRARAENVKLKGDNSSLRARLVMQTSRARQLTRAAAERAKRDELKALEVREQERFASQLNLKVQKRLEKTQDENSSLSSGLVRAQKEVRGTRRENQQLKIEVDRLKALNKSLQKTLSKAKTQKQRAAAQAIQKLTEENEEMQRELLDVKKTGLRREIKGKEELSREQRKNEREVAALRAELEDAKRRLSVAQDQALLGGESLLKARTTLEADRAALDAARLALSEQARSLQSERARWVAEREATEATLRQQRADVEHSQQALGRRLQDVSRRELKVSSGSMAGLLDLASMNEFDLINVFRDLTSDMKRVVGAMTKDTKNIVDTQPIRTLLSAISEAQAVPLIQAAGTSYLSTPADDATGMFGALELGLGAGATQGAGAGDVLNRSRRLRQEQALRAVSTAGSRGPDALFDKLDANKDGFISYQEFKRGLGLATDGARGAAADAELAAVDYTMSKSLRGQEPIGLAELSGTSGGDSKAAPSGPAQ